MGPGLGKIHITAGEEPRGTLGPGPGKMESAEWGCFVMEVDSVVDFRAGVIFAPVL